MKDSINFQEPSININGKYKIQLFDKDTGKMIQEVEKHNVISKIPFSTAFYNHIYRGFLNNDNRYGCDFSNTNNGYINFLMLTNDPDALENDDKNPVVLGETIGYAQYGDTNSVEDTKRGIFNKNETKMIFNHYPNGAKAKNATKHIVFDFGTDKANGTFDNIYLLPTKNCSNPDSYRGQETFFDAFVVSNNEDYKSNSDKNYQGDRGAISHSEKYLYMQCLYYKEVTNRQYWNKIARIDLDTWERKYITLNVPSEEASKPAYIIYACGMFWRINREWKTTRYNLSGEYKDTLNIGKNFIMTYYYLRMAENFIGIDRSNLDFTYFEYFTGDDEYLYISYRREDTDKNSKKYYENHIVLIDKNGKKVSEVLFNKSDFLPESSIKLNIAYINNEKYLIANNYTNEKPQVFKVDNGTLIKKSSNILKSVSDFKKPFFYSKDGFLFVVGSGDAGWTYSIYVYTLIPWGSHCKLSSPVTKTSANTMKIQYDITVDYIMPGMISNLK